MRVGRTLRGLSAIGALLLMLTAGCTISIQPWTKPVAAPVPSGPVDLLPPPNPNGPYPLPKPGGIISQAQFGPNNELTAILGARLANAEEEMSTLKSHVNLVKKDKAKQDDQLIQATREIEQTLTQIQKLRQDLKSWKTDVDDMNKRIETLETNRATMIHLLEQVRAHMDREAKAGPKLR